MPGIALMFASLRIQKAQAWSIAPVGLIALVSGCTGQELDSVSKSDLGRIESRIDLSNGASLLLAATHYGGGAGDET